MWLTSRISWSWTIGSTNSWCRQQTTPCCRLTSSRECWRTDQSPTNSDPPLTTVRLTSTGQSWGKWPRELPSWQKEADWTERKIRDQVVSKLLLKMISSLTPDSCKPTVLSRRESRPKREANMLSEKLFSTYWMQIQPEQSTSRSSSRWSRTTKCSQSWQTEMSSRTHGRSQPRLSKGTKSLWPTCSQASPMITPKESWTTWREISSTTRKSTSKSSWSWWK